MLSYGIGLSQYHGDLHDILYDGIGSSVGPTLGVGLRRKFGSQVSLRLDVNWYEMGGNDADNGFITDGKDSGQRTGRRNGVNDTRFVRNLNFRSRNWEVAALLTFNLIPVDGSYTRRPLINPYLMVGLARTKSRPQTFLPGEEGNYSVNLWEIQTEAAGIYPNWFTVIPVGFGIRLKANQYIDILLEGARRFTFTDYLDDIATVYPSREEIIEWNGGAGSPTAEIALQIFDRSAEGGFAPRNAGNTRGRDNNDAYYIFQIRLEMYLPDNFLSELFSPSRRKPKFR